MQIKDSPAQSKSQGQNSRHRKNCRSPIAEIPAPAAMRREAVRHVLLDWLETVALDKNLLPSATVIAMTLANYLPNTGNNVWPSVAKIAEELGFSESTVRRSLKALRDRQHLSFEWEAGR